MTYHRKISVLFDFKIFVGVRETLNYRFSWNLHFHENVKIERIRLSKMGTDKQKSVVENCFNDCLLACKLFFVAPAGCNFKLTESEIFIYEP